MSEKAEKAWQWIDRAAKLAALLVFPILAWAFRVELFMSQGARFTPGDAELLELQIHEYVEARMATLPPSPFREKVERIERITDESNRRIQQIEISLAELKGDMGAIRLILNNGADD